MEEKTEEKKFSTINKIGAILIIGILSLHIISETIHVQLLPGFLGSLLFLIIVLVVGLFLVLKKEKKKNVK
jgi:hypothetical protein